MKLIIIFSLLCVCICGEVLYKFEVKKPTLYNITSEKINGYKYVLNENKVKIHVLSKTKLIAQCYLFEHCINQYLVKSFESFHMSEAIEWARKEKCIIPKDYYSWGSDMISCTNSMFKYESEDSDPKKIDSSKIKNNGWFYTCNILYGCDYQELELPVFLSYHEDILVPYIHYFNTIKVQPGKNLVDRVTYSIYLDFHFTIDKENVTITCLKDENQNLCSSGSIHFNKVSNGGCSGHTCVQIANNVDDTKTDESLEDVQTADLLEYQELNFEYFISTINTELMNSASIITKIVEYNAFNDPYFLNKIFDTDIVTEFVDKNHFLMKKSNNKMQDHDIAKFQLTDSDEVKSISLSFDEPSNLVKFSNAEVSDKKVIDYNAKLRFEKNLNDFFENTKGKIQSNSDVFNVIESYYDSIIEAFKKFISFGVISFIIIILLLVALYRFFSSILKRCTEVKDNKKFERIKPIYHNDV